MRAEDTAKDLSDPANFKPGLYRHYKGGMYVALFLGRHHEGGTLMVAYVSMARGTINFREWAKPGKDSWIDMVQYPAKGGETYSGEIVPRFTYLGPAPGH